MSRRDIVDELREETAKLEQLLAEAQASLDQAVARSTEAAAVMYRRGYLAGHTAARRNHTTRRGPYRTQDGARG